MAGDFLNLQALDGHGNIVLDDVVRRELGGVVVEDVRRWPCGQKPREIGAVVGVCAAFAANHQDTIWASASRMSLGRSR